MGFWAWLWLAILARVGVTAIAGHNSVCPGSKGGTTHVHAVRPVARKGMTITTYANAKVEEVNALHWGPILQNHLTFQVAHVCATMSKTRILTMCTTQLGVVAGSG